ncbi:MAG: NADH-quinone oxidoreductase subunit M [Chitinophagaceae bacterium]|nr:NADH-quinone oxidoreductase subunit M [Chitinophagaceae bacterium]
MYSVLLILIPLLGGVVSFFIKSERSARINSLFTSLLSLGVVLAGLLFYREDKYWIHDGAWLSVFNSSFSLKADGLSKIFILLNALAYVLLFVSGWKVTYHNINRFYGLFLLTQAGMTGTFLAYDALLFYFFWELALIPMYFLCSQWGGPRRISVTLKFFIYTFAGSVLMLVSILYLYSKTSGMSFSFQEFADTRLQPARQIWLFWLFFIGLAIKMPVFPLHTWQPDTYEQSPYPGTAVLSAVMAKMGLFGLLRWLFHVLPIASFQWADFITPLALSGAIYASLLAFRQDDLKRFAAYSSMAHMGLLCAASFAQNLMGFQGVMLQAFNHGINILGLWIIVEIIERKTGTRKMSELGGLSQKAPALSVFLMVIALANIALPLTNSFPGEFLMISGIFTTLSKYNVWFTVLAGLGIILGAVYMLNMIRKVFFGEEKESVFAVTDISWNEKTALGIIVGIILVLGVYPQLLLQETSATAGAINEKFEIVRKAVLEQLLK